MVFLQCKVNWNEVMCVRASRDIINYWSTILQNLIGAIFYYADYIQIKYACPHNYFQNDSAHNIIILVAACLVDDCDVIIVQHCDFFVGFLF